MPELVILLPTKNEEEGIGEVIDRLPTKEEISRLGYSLKIVVADGHSTDKTCQIAEEKGAMIIHQEGGAGKGNGVREALEVIFEKFSDKGSLLIMMDGDATYSPEDVVTFIEILQENEVVWGSRMRGNIAKNAMSKTNWFGNWILSLTASIVFLKRTTDLCTGYWGFRLTSLRKLHLTAEGFNLEADLFASVAKSKMRTSEIPIDYSHREGQSNLKWYRDGPRIMLMTISHRFK